MNQEESNAFILGLLQKLPVKETKNPEAVSSVKPWFKFFFDFGMFYIHTLTMIFLC